MKRDAIEHDRVVSSVAMDATGTVGRGWDRMRKALFPFDFGHWISYGVIFFLQSLLEGGGTSIPSTGSRSRGHGSAVGLDWREIAGDVQRWIDANKGSLVLVGTVTVVLVLALGTLLIWLGTRGQMMSIRAVATGRPAIGEHWAETRVAGWSLFKTHLVISGGAFLVGAPLAGLAAFRLLDLAVSGAPDDAVIAGMLPFVVVGSIFWLVMTIITGILRNFVAPVMQQCHMNVGQAWSHFAGAASGHWGAIALFFVIRFFFALVATIVALVATVCTCCIGALPVIHQTIMAPWYFFERAYAL
ncbi:MAG TPA: hypothetical protein VH054_13810, partial [Polyangiaceae bacterium]|nr:hypothetical protein [Polyangiaceae bacterium]